MKGGAMLAKKVLDLAETQGLLDARVLADLRRQIGESKFVVTPEAIAKILVDKGHLTAFQARKLVASALGEGALAAEPTPPPAASPPATPPASPPVTPPAKTPARRPVEEELYLADEPPPPKAPPKDDVVLLQPVAPAKPAPKTSADKPPSFKSPAAKAPPSKPPPDEEVVDLLVVQPAATPPKKPAAEKSRPTKPRPGEAVTKADLVEEIVDLQIAPVAPTPARPPRVMLQPPTPAAPIDLLAHDPLMALTPLGGDLLTPLGGDLLTPLGADPFGGGQQPQPGAAPTRPLTKSQWESPWLFIAAALLGLTVIVFVVLYFGIFNGAAADLFAKAEEQYNAGSYTAAITLYDQFLKSNPQNQNASLARVRRGMAELKQNSNEGKNAAQGLTNATRILPQIESEEAFGDARPELRTLLVDIASRFADQAAEANDLRQKETLVKSTEEALQLVDNSAYIPSSMKVEVQPRINLLHDKLKAARRGIDQDRRLADSVAAIRAHTEKADAAKAYDIRRDLLREYPGLEANKELAEATRLVGAKERELVKVRSETVPPLSDELPRGPTALILASREPKSTTAPAAKGWIAPVMLPGSLYGVDMETGAIAWRRSVSPETAMQPFLLSKEPGAGLIAADFRRQEIMRLDSVTGKIVWRHALGQPFELPVVGGDNLFIATANGQIVEMDLASGQSARQVQLPQTPTVAAAVDWKGTNARTSRIYQLGKHSTLFVLNGETLACEETVYIGHRAGSALVAPAATLNHLLVAESPADDYSYLHVLAPHPETKKLVKLPDSFRLKGRITTPMVVAGKRVIAATDLGQVIVLEVDPTTPENPVKQIVEGAEAVESAPLAHFLATVGQQVFVGSHYLVDYEIQAAQGKLGRRWTSHREDQFQTPPQLNGDVALCVFRRPGSHSTTLEANRILDGHNIWTTELAMPLAAIIPSEARKQIVAINSLGAVYEIPGEALGGVLFDKTAFTPSLGTQSFALSDGLSVGGGRWAIAGQAGGARALLYATGADANRTKELSFKIPPNSAAAAPAFFQEGLLLPLFNGQVALLHPETGEPLALPFQPALQPGARVAWSRPTVLADGKTAVISDGRRTIYRLSLKGEPQPNVISVGETNLDGDSVASPAAVEDSVYIVTRGDDGDLLLSFQATDFAPGAKAPLQGRLQWGPTAVGKLVFLADSKTLYAYGAGQKAVWSLPLSHGALAAAPLAVESDWLLLYKSGAVSRVTGGEAAWREAAVTQTGESLGSKAVIAGTRLFVASSDGALLTLPIPQRP